VPAKILVVEDDADGLWALAKMLRIAGYDVQTADGYQSAMEIAKTNPIDLVLCDVGLWDGDGCDLFLELKQKYSLDGIAVTAFGMADEIHRFLEAGFKAHVPKPVIFAQLLQAIAQVLGDKQLSAALPNVIAPATYIPSV
jgi:CheY-like chemotaxis protein